MKVSFEGIGEMIVTFYNDGANTARAGDPVKMRGNGEVGVCNDGERFIGVAIGADDEYAAVQTAGYVAMPYTGFAPEVGYSRLVSAGSGAVTVDSGSAGAEYLVVDVNEADNRVGFIL